MCPSDISYPRQVNTYSIATFTLSYFCVLWLAIYQHLLIAFLVHTSTPQNILMDVPSEVK